MEVRHRYSSAAIALLSSLLITTAVTAQTVGDGTRAQILSENWRKAHTRITRGPDGSVIFSFGGAQPSVTCAPLQLCEIQLERGELVHDVLVGDTVRWKVESAISGADGDQRVSIIVKPLRSGLSTSMVITTQRRVYHIALKSRTRNYVARVSFSYKDERSSVSGVKDRPHTAVESHSENRNYAYLIRGDNPSWRPMKVYNDRTKTYIQFAGSAAGDALVLYVVSGGLFALKGKVTNYRLDGNTMVIDHLFDKAVLVSGVGSPRQTRVVIERAG